MIMKMKDILKRKLTVGLVVTLLTAQLPVTTFAVEMPEFRTEQILKTENLISEPTEDEPAEAEEILLEDAAGALSAQEVLSDENHEPGEDTESEVVENEESAGEDGYTEVSTWDELQEQLNAGGNVKLTSDVTAGAGDSALMIPLGANVTLNLNGHTIDRGLSSSTTAVEGGNVITVNGNLTLTDSSTDKTGKLTGGNTLVHGGGVYVMTNGRFTMKSGTITGCNAHTQGGGVYVEGGEFSMTGGTISGCSADYGGGVAAHISRFTMEDGTISGCNAYMQGGGVYVKVDSEFTMTGGTISGCSADSGVGGVYVDQSSTFTISGTPVIRGNKKDVSANNVVLDGGKTTITVTGELTTGAEIWVNADKGVAFAKKEGSYNITDTDLAKFHSDTDSSLVAAEDSDGSVKFFTPWEALQVKFNNASTVAGSPTRITLTGSVTAYTGDSPLLIPEGKHVTLDLNGHTIDRGLAVQPAVGYGNVITVKGNLTLDDSSDNENTPEYDGTGKLTGGNNNGYGGGVDVSRGTFTMNGGTISGCSVTGDGSVGGGGVFVGGGTFTMNGGAITGCKVDTEFYWYGGGVFVDEGSTFTMSGGTIESCRAKGNGGGVSVLGGTFTMEGGTITNCSAEKDGGVSVSYGTFTMSGGTITNCSANITDGIDGVSVYSGTFTMSGGTIESCRKGGVSVGDSTFTMSGGTITNCSARNGGGVSVGWNCEFTMSGGTISGCSAEYEGGGVYVINGGTFTMEKGTITGCSAGYDGGGVFVDGNTSSRGTFTMTGGTITNCSAKKGGGVSVEGGKFTMNGGTIIGCKAEKDSSYGGGVYVDDGTFNMSGAPVIRDNKKGDVVNNVVLKSGKTITVTGELTTGAEIWVNAGKDVAFATKGDSYSITDTDLAKFHSDADSSLVAAEDSDGSVKFFTPWGALQAKFNNASTVEGSPTQIKLTGNVTASGNETALVIPEDRYVTLDLNGHTIDRGFANKDADGAGTVIMVEGDLILTDRSAAQTGTLTGGNTTGAGGGVYVDNLGEFTMEGGTISGCEATNGGGVYVNSGTFNSGTFIMNGGSITNCSANSEGGGVYVDEGSKFTMTDGTISGCSATGGYNSNSYGGGVCVNGGTFTMENGTISGCEATNGGGVYVNRGTFTMENSTISGCSASFSGGVYVNGGEFTMNDGTISGCSATDENSRGGGVYVDEGSKFTMNGGTISDCSASYGGGVYVEVSTFQVSGSPVISGNKISGTNSPNNVELNGKTISVNGALTSGAEIHVNAGKGDVVATGENYTLQASDADAFRSDRPSSLTAALDSDGKVKFFNPWGALQAKFNNASTVAGSPTQIKLTGNVTASGNETALVIPENRYVTLDLNGNIINRGLANVGAVAGGNVITVKGNLTLSDNSTDHTGTITGGNNNGNGGGVYVGESGKFTMENSTISGCNANGYGGGVYVYEGGAFTTESGTISGCNAALGGGVNVDSGTFTMTGGTITGCNAYNSGGGVCVNGSFTMTGGTITDCNATSHGGRGGGVYVEGGGKFTMEGGTIDRCNTEAAGGGVYNHGTFNMSDGTIRGCSVTGVESNGGGVYIEDRGTFKVSGTPVISGNMKGSTSANNVELGGKTISVNGALTSGAEIHVNARLGVPIAEKGGDRTTALTETEAGYFKSDVSSDLLGGLNDAGQVVFKKPLPASTAPADLTYNGTEQTPELTFEGATLTAGTDYTVSYKKVVEGTETSIIGAPKDAGTYKAVAAGKGNYAGTSEAEFTIARKEVTVSSGILAEDKTYDGTTAATLDTTGAVFDEIYDGDSLTVSGNGAFADASAGSGKNVTISDLTLGGTSSGNYVLASDGNQRQTTATISKKKLTITGVTVTDKEYDGYTTATTNITNAVVTGLVGSDNVEFTVSGAFADANKGENKPVTLSNWTFTNGGDNYEIDAANSQKEAFANITGTQVYITGIHAVNKEYDGNKTATVSGTAVLKKVKDNSTVSDLSVSNITADFADKNVSDNKAVTITGGTLSDSENYTLIPGATTGLTANITPKPVTITGLSAKNKEYDTTAAATVTGTAVIDGKIGNDDVTVLSGTAAFDNANVSDNKTVTFTGYSLTGEDASNYELSGQPADVTANITKATPTIIAPAASAITYGQNLSNSTLTNGAAKLGETSIEGSFAWSDNTIAPAVSDSNKTEYTVTFTPNDTTNLNPTTCKVKLTVNKADITADQLTAPAKVEDLKYTGQAQALISAGSVSGNIGTMQYALGTDASTSPTNGWGKVIPTGTNAGTYYVWYKVVGDANHNDYVSVSPVSVTIEKAEYTGTKTVSVSVRSGKATSNKTVTLPSLPEGASYASSGTVSGQTIDLISSNSISGTTLTFSTTAQDDLTSATITIRVTNATNYNDYDVVVTVTAKAKDEAGVVIAQGATLNKAYGDADLTLNATVSKAGEGTGTWTWTSTAADVLSVTGSGSSATAHILKPGTATVKAEYESDTTMGEASIQINIAKGEKPANAPTVLNVKYEVTAISSCGLPDGWVWNTSDPNYSKTIPEGGSLAVTADYSAADRMYYNTTRVSVTIYRADGGKKDDTETIKEDIGDNKAAPKGIWIANLESSYTYTGRNITPEVHVYAEDLLLTKGLDYTVSYKNNKNANDASVASKAPTVTVKLKGSYSGTKSATFRIAKLDLSTAIAQDIYKPVAKKAYGTIKPALYIDGTELKLAGSEAAYENPTGDYYSKPGTYDITVKAKNTAKNVTGTRKVKLHIVDAPTMEKVKAKASKSSYKYGDIKGITDPKEAVPVKVTYNNAVITEGFKVIYESGTSWKTLGTHYITIKGDGKTYYGEKKISYKVTGKYSLDDDNAWVYIDGKKCDAGSDNISVSYNKTGIKPAVSIRYKPDFGSDQFVLTERQDFTVSYRNNRNAGDTAEVTIKGKGIYSGKLTRKFTVSKVDLNDLILFVSDRAESKTKDDFKKTTKILYDKNLVDQKAPLKDFDIKYTDKDGKEISGTPAKGTLVNVTVTAKDTCKNFTGTKSTGFHIIDKTKDVGKMKVSFTYDKNAKGKNVGYYFFTGAEIRPQAVSQLHVKSGQTELKASDYSVRYFNNVNKGNKAAVLITGNDTAGYFGVKTAYFKIGNAAPLVFDKSSGTFK